MAARTPLSLLRRTLLICLGLTLVAALLYLYARNWGPSRESYPTQGIDVSYHQGVIDWNKVRAAGVDFAYIKATEGADLHDERFADNWRVSATAGIQRGAYHFFTLCRLARDQAENFIAHVPRDGSALPHALDLEFGGNCSARPARDVVLSEIATFLKMVEAHSEKPMILYLTKEFDDRYGVSNAIDRSLWLRKIAFPPDYGARPWVMWQASSLRAVDGIEGRVDWNVVRK
ncbi:MAG: GH25 family lysozyme [Sphingomonadaceae bacterium]